MSGEVVVSIRSACLALEDSLVPEAGGNATNAGLFIFTKEGIFRADAVIGAFDMVESLWAS
jgi:hypothetical protein